MESGIALRKPRLTDAESSVRAAGCFRTETRAEDTSVEIEPLRIARCVQRVAPRDCVAMGSCGHGIVSSKKKEVTMRGLREVEGG